MHRAVVLVVIVCGYRDSLALLLGLNRNLFKTFLVGGAFGRCVSYFVFVPSVYAHVAVEGVDGDARRSSYSEGLRFFGCHAIAGVFNACAHAVNSRDSLLPHLFAVRAFNLTLGTFDVSLRLAHGHVNLPLRFSLCFSGFDCDFHILRFSSTFGASTLDRRSRAKRQSVLCMTDLDTAVDVLKPDAWTTGSDLSFHAVADVLAVFDFQTEIGRDAAMDRTRTNRSVCVRRNHERDATVYRTQRNRLRIVELREDSLQWSIDRRQPRFTCQAARDEFSVNRRCFYVSF